MGRARKFTGTTSRTVKREVITPTRRSLLSVHISTTTICGADHYSSESMFTHPTFF
jgi:hypothetical protein